MTMSLTAIVPVYNGGDGLRRCLEALLTGSRRPDELIVVDDGSIDGSGEIARQFGARVIHLAAGPSGPATARNRGAAAAHGDVFLFFDADVLVHQDTVALIEDYLARNPSVDALFGSYDDDPPARGIVSRYKNLAHHYVHQQGRTEAGTFWAGCGAVRRSAFDAVGGFDERYSRPSIEDIELGVRLRRAGYRIWLCPDIQVAHLKHWTLISLLRSDIRDRAVPWSQLIFREGELPDDLNLGWRSRLSALAAWSVAMAGPAAVSTGVLEASSRATGLWPWFAIVGLLGLTGLLILNRDFHRFFAQQGGPVFALSAAILHWLYLLYSSAVLALVMVSSRLKPQVDDQHGRPAAPLNVHDQSGPGTA